MAYKIVKTEQSYLGKEGYPIITAVLDSVDDLLALGKHYGAGSIAIVAIKNAVVYMMNASGEWSEL